MANNINVLEVLESKPNGTKLWCVLFGKCFLDGIDINNIRPIRIGIEKGDTFKLTANAKLSGKYIDGDCLLYPSKEMRDWSRFAWKKGDILISSDGGTEVIFDKWYDDTYTSFYCKHYLNSEDETKFVYYEEFICTTERYAIEDKDKAQIYIGIIEERLGGKLNCETLEIEKAQPEFKDGDIITITTQIGNNLIFIFREEDIEKYYCHAFLYGKITIVNDDSFCKKDFCTARPSTGEEQKQFFDALTKKGKAWDAVKKQIVDLKPKWTPKPFDRVITRTPETPWTANFFSHIDSDGIKNCIDDRYIMCLPYNDETAKLIGTTNNWNG